MQHRIWHYRKIDGHLYRARFVYGQLRELQVRLPPATSLYHGHYRRLGLQGPTAKAVLSLIPKDQREQGWVR